MNLKPVSHSNPLPFVVDNRNLSRDFLSLWLNAGKLDMEIETTFRWVRKDIFVLIFRIKLNSLVFCCSDHCVHSKLMMTSSFLQDYWLWGRSSTMYCNAAENLWYSPRSPWEESPFSSCWSSLPSLCCCWKRETTSCLTCLLVFLYSLFGITQLNTKSILSLVSSLKHSSQYIGAWITIFIRNTSKFVIFLCLVDLKLHEF